MKVDHVLILAAGKGTRMGEIGTIKPKVIWPVFEKSLLELEVLYSKELAPGAKIHINLFHESEIILEHIKSSPILKDVDVIIEKCKLDIGGAIHNLARGLNYNGTLLVLNSDQFLYFDKSFFREGLKKLTNVDSLLFTYDVNSSDGYNALDISDENLTGIIPNNSMEAGLKIRTYSGMSLIKLANLDPCMGISTFFETVADYKKKKVHLLNIPNVEYWDFGTSERYYKAMFLVLEKTKSKFVEFLIRNNAFFLNKIIDKGYQTESGINLSKKELSNCGESIVLEAPKELSSIREKQIILGDKVNSF
jgi:NDP-sugar pyrophosphorylase family protein